MDMKEARYKQKRQRINLDLAKDGATHLLQSNYSKQWQLSYKEAVRLLYLLNQELDDEILTDKVKPLLIEELEVI